MTKKDYLRGLFGGFITIIFSAIYDFIKHKPFLSTLVSSIKWVWNTIFEFEVKIWQIIIIGLLLVFIKKILLTNKKEVINNQEIAIKWLGYTEDTIDGVIWSWNWQKKYGSGNYYITELVPLCECKTPMKLYNGSSFAICPRCDKHISDFKSPDKIDAIIIDNIKRDLYLDKIEN